MEGDFANILCVQVSFFMLAILFYFVNCVIISYELCYDNSLKQRMYADELQIIQSQLEINNIIK